MDIRGAVELLCEHMFEPFFHEPEFEVPASNPRVLLSGFTADLHELFAPDSEQLAFRGVLTPSLWPLAISTVLAQPTMWVPFYSSRFSGVSWAPSVAWAPTDSGAASAWSSATYWLPRLWDGSPAINCLAGFDDSRIVWLPINPRVVDWVRCSIDREVVRAAARQFLQGIERRARQRARTVGKPKLLTPPCRIRRQSMHRPCARRALKPSSEESADIDASWSPVVREVCQRLDQLRVRDMM
jgi:hypothetical protein